MFAETLTSDSISLIFMEQYSSVLVIGTLTPMLVHGNQPEPFYTKEWRASNFPYIITPESSISGCKNKGNDQQVKELY